MTLTQSRSTTAKGRSRRRKPIADTVDPFELYSIAVQDPEGEIRFISETFAQLRGREARTIREDFCGTAKFSAEWAKTDPKREAWGVDLDAETLAWGRDNLIVAQGLEQRVHLIEGNVLDGLGPKVDCSVAFNFSYWCFKKRPLMLRYLEVVRESLADDGLLFLDCFGGLEGPQDALNRVDHDGFTYIWEQSDFNPLTNECSCAIHFEFKDGSRIDQAFTYDWRMWSLPELRDLLEEAGFSKVRIFWEEEEDSGEFTEPEVVDNDDLWWTYIVAER